VKSQLANDREQAHQLARQKMTAGDFPSAVGLLVQSYQSFGPHILSLVDLASSYYMLQDYLNFRHWTFLALEEWKKSKASLSLETIQSCALALGKLLEELGQIQASMGLYESVTTYIQGNRFTEKIQAQVLRLNCLIGDMSKVSTHYMSREMAQWIDASCDFDTQHALMHADCMVNGTEAAAVRVLKKIADPLLSNHFRQLLFFDFLFEALRKNEAHLICTDSFKYFEYIQVDAFEQFLWDLYLFDQGLVPFETVTHLRSHGLSPMCSLRTLHLIQQRDLLGPESSMARSKFLLLSQQLDATSRSWILAAWPLNTLDKSGIHLELTGDILSYQKMNLNFQNQTASKDLIQKLSAQPTLQTDHLVVQIYGLEPSESTYGRLKTLISRLNKSLEALCGIQKPIRFSKTQIALKDGIRIRRVS